MKMASLPGNSADASASSTRDPQAALAQTLMLLKSKNDTSRFVGLSLLRTLLDTHVSLRDDPVTITRCWIAISPKFLKKLLQARRTDKRSEDEAHNMVTLAVSVIYAFTVLLEQEALEEQQVTGLCGALIESLTFSGAATRVLALQALSTIASRPKGASAICQVEDIKPLIEAAVEGELATSVIRFVLISTMKYSAGGDEESTSRTQTKGDGIIQTLIDAFEGKDQLRLLETISNVLEESQVSSRKQEVTESVLVHGRALL